MPEYTVDYKNVYTWHGPELDMPGVHMAAGGSLAYEMVGFGEDQELVTYEKQFVKVHTKEFADKLGKDGQIQTSLCLPDFSYNAIACSIFTFEADQIKYYSWFNMGTTEFPPFGKESRLKDAMWYDYLAANPNVMVNANQEMKILDNGLKTIQKDGEQAYNFVSSSTNVEWPEYVEATFYARNPYYQNKDWLDSLMRGETKWEGWQYLAYYDDEGTAEITKDWV